MSDDKTPEERLAGCAGCGLSKAINEESPAGYETTFTVVEEDEEDVVFECDTCETRTYIPKERPESAECRKCGKEIPEYLQGSHSCESHPLGQAADISFENPMKDHR